MNLIVTKSKSHYLSMCIGSELWKCGQCLTGLIGVVYGKQRLKCKVCKAKVSFIKDNYYGWFRV